MLSIAVIIILCHTVNAQKRELDIDSCRSLAVQNNYALKEAKARQRVSHYQTKAAFTNFLPKLSAAGTYQRTQKEISLLNDEQKYDLSHIGTTGSKHIEQMLAENPSLAGQLAPFMPVLTGMESSLNQLGNGLVDALRTDTRNMAAVGAILTQPLYVGGKITAYNNITHYAEKLAQSQYSLCEEEVILNADKAYWTVVSLVNKKKLADNYLKLLKKLDNDVYKMIEQGIATKAEGLSVDVKLNEAEMALLQVENGLSLSKMLLCQICGIPLDTDIMLYDEKMDNLPMTSYEMDGKNNDFVSEALSRREELKSLDIVNEIYRQKIKIARSEFLPNLALTGGYLLTNPSIYNGFENKFRGNWTVGVTLTMPIFHWGEGVYKVKAAKAEAIIKQYEWEDAREKIELEINQNSYKLTEARKKLETSVKNLEKAEENLRHAELGMNEGVIPVSNVLEAQTAWLSAHTDKIGAQIDLRLADLYLQKSLGKLNH